MTGPLGSAILLVGPGLEASVELIRPQLAAASLGHRVELLRRVDDAEALAREAIAGGERFLVSVGGDDVVHHVVNGIFGNGTPETSPVLGVIAAGTENEFLRQFGIPLDTERATRHLLGENVYPIDVGMVRCAGPNGEQRSRIFANIGAVGLGARMAERAAGARSRRTLFLAFWRAVITARRATVHVEASRKTYDGPAFDVVVGNGRFGPGGFRVSPRSFPGDGVFEVLVHHGPRSHAFTSLPKASRGEQVPSPHITELRGNRVVIRSDPELPVAVDGRPVGHTPAEFHVLPRALLLKV